MFGWLAKMLISGPVQGSSCSCCEGKKKELRRMQQVIENGEIPVSETEEQHFCSGSYQAECSLNGSCRETYSVKEEKNTCAHGDGICDCHRY